MLVALGCIAGTSCATQSSAAAPAGSSAGAAYLPLKLASGEPTDLARLRGSPVLVFLFATYDGASQLALQPLSALHAQRPELRVLGIAVQPDAAAFLPPYASALDVRFPLAFDPSGELLRGTTSLGEVPAVPYYLLLDASGIVIERHVGVLEGDALEAFVAPALR